MSRVSQTPEDLNHHAGNKSTKTERKNKVPCGVRRGGGSGLKSVDEIEMGKRGRKP